MTWLPLDGVRIVDISSVVMGPFGTQQLGDLGADVIVIEDRRGDANRAMGSSRHPDFAGPTLGLMRNKRSVGLDLKTEHGRAAMRRLVGTADVVVTNLRPKVRSRLGLTFDELRSARPDLIMVAAVGFRPDSPDADLPAYDDVVQSLVGVTHMMQGIGLPPTYFPTIYVDKLCGMAIAQAVMGALYERAHTGQGREVLLAMYEIMRGFNLVEHGSDAISFPNERPAGYSRLLAADRAPQPTADGMIAALPYEKNHFEALFKLAGRDDLIGDPRIQSRRGLIDNRTELRTLVRECLATKTTAEWLELLPANGVPAAPLNTLDDIVADLPIIEHPYAGDYKVVPSALGEIDPAVVRRPAPLKWEHTREVLGELGYADDEIDDMYADGSAY